MSRGALLKGKVLDAAGRGMQNLAVTASSSEPDDSSGSGWTSTLPDGSFQFEAMVRRAVNVFTGEGAVGFGLAAGVVPGSSPITITLRPPGRARLLIRAPDGTPVADAYTTVNQVDGVKVVSVGRSPGSDAQGIADVLVPAGRVELFVWQDGLRTPISLEVSEGGSVSAEVTLASTPPDAN
jgi:hypothetical protein